MGQHYPLQDVCLAVICGTPLLASLLVGLRFYARRKPGYKLDWDDWLIALALVLSFADIGPSYKYVKMWHVGIHIWNVNPNDLEPNYDQYYFVLLGFNLINILILPLIKASIILLLLRIGAIIPWIRKSLMVVQVFNVGACIVPWVIMIFMCPPQTGNTWKPRTFGGLKCVGQGDIKQMLVFVNCANLFTDLLIFPIPYLIMRRATYMSKWARLVVVLLFASSLAVTAIGAAKIYTSYRDRLYTLYPTDWTYPIVFCINHIENNVAISVACVPALRHMIRGWTSSNSGGSRRTSANGNQEFRWSDSQHSDWRIRRAVSLIDAYLPSEENAERNSNSDSKSKKKRKKSGDKAGCGGGGGGVGGGDKAGFGGCMDGIGAQGGHHHHHHHHDIDVEQGIRVTTEVELTSNRKGSQGGASDHTWRSSALTLTRDGSTKDGKRGSVTTTMTTTTLTTNGDHKSGPDSAISDMRESKEMFVEEDEITYP